MTKIRTLTAKYRSRCVTCGQEIAPGDRIVCAGPKRTMHEGCFARGPEVADSAGRPWRAGERPEHVGTYADEDFVEMSNGRRLTQREADSEYARGVAEAQRYLDDRRIYGAELADAWELERELREGW